MAKTDCCPTKELVVKEELLPENCPPKPDCIPITINPPDNADVPGKCDSKIRYQPSDGTCPGRYWAYVCDSGWIGFPYPLPNCIKPTNGMPTTPPLECDIPIKFDPCTGIFWFYTCDGGWQKEKQTLCFLDHLDNLPANICDELRIPAFFEDPCCTEGYLTLSELVEQLWACGCPPTSDPIVPGDGKLILYCSDNNGVVKGPLEIDVCDLLSDVPSGGPLSVPPGGNLTIFDPTTCTNRAVTFETECCDCYQEQGFAAGGGVCFNVTTTPTVNAPVIFRGRDLTFIQGAGTNSFDLNGVGLVSVAIQNPWGSCPCSYRATMRIMANRSLGTPDVGMGYIYKISETLAEPLPTSTVVVGSGNPANAASTNYQNEGFLTLDVINNYDLSHEGEAENTNYSAMSGAPVYWSGTLGNGASDTLYGQWWAMLAAVAGGGGGQGIIIGHCTMQVTVQYFQGGQVINAIQN